MNPTSSINQLNDAGPIDQPESSGETARSKAINGNMTARTRHVGMVARAACSPGLDLTGVPAGRPVRVVGAAGRCGRAG